MARSDLRRPTRRSRLTDVTARLGRDEYMRKQAQVTALRKLQDTQAAEAKQAAKMKQVKSRAAREKARRAELYGRNAGGLFRRPRQSLSGSATAPSLGHRRPRHSTGSSTIRATAAPPLDLTASLTDSTPPMSPGARSPQHSTAMRVASPSPEPVMRRRSTVVTAAVLPAPSPVVPAATRSSASPAPGPSKPWRLGYTNKVTATRTPSPAADLCDASSDDDSVAAPEDWRPSFAADPNPASWPVSLLHAHTANREAQVAYATVGAAGHSDAKTLGRPPWRPSNAPATVKAPLRGTDADLERSASAPLGASRRSSARGSPASHLPPTSPLTPPSPTAASPTAGAGGGRERRASADSVTFTPAAVVRPRPSRRHRPLSPATQRLAQAKMPSPYDRTLRPQSPTSAFHTRVQQRGGPGLGTVELAYTVSDRRRRLSDRGSTRPTSPTAYGRRDPADVVPHGTPLPTTFPRRKSTTPVVTGLESYTQPTSTYAARCVVHTSHDRYCRNCRSRAEALELKASVTKHAAVTRKVAGATKAHTTTRQTGLRSGTVRFSAELDQSQMAELLAEQQSETERRRQSRRDAVSQFVRHRLFFRLNFPDVKAVARSLANAVSPSRRVSNTTAASLAHFRRTDRLSIAEPCSARARPVLLSREQFLKVFSGVGMSSREDVALLNRVFSAFDAQMRDAVNLSTFCHHFHHFQADARASDPRRMSLGLDGGLVPSTDGPRSFKAKVEALLLDMFVDEVAA